MGHCADGEIETAKNLRQRSEEKRGERTIKTKKTECNVVGKRDCQRFEIRIEDFLNQVVREIQMLRWCRDSQQKT